MLYPSVSSNMSSGIPSKLLEIIIISAQDLPPVSKLLRTFVVAWIDPDHKLSTKINHHGHTNPTWNYKLVFKVEDRFLRSESASASVNIEIYNVAWLRDLPIGTTHLMINHLLPPLVLNNPTMRIVSLHICRPSGHLQGTLNVGINILDHFNQCMPPGELSASLTNYDAMQNQNVEKQRFREDEREKEEAKMEERRDLKIEKLSNVSSIKSPFDEAIKMSSEKSTLSDKASRLEVQSKGTAANASMISVVKPIPSELAVNFKKGLYSTAGEDYGSSIFENWSEGGDGSNGFGSKSMTRQIEDQFPDKKDHHSKKAWPKRRTHSEGGGLFSCFGKGFELTFVCGSSSMNKNRTKLHHRRHFSDSDDNKHRFFK